ncbi:MAG: helix-turn-helix domain-containing protein [Patescibacteria group bacterium]
MQNRQHLEQIAKARAPEDLPLFLTVPEAAAVLRRGTAFIYESVNRGELKAVRSGRGGKIMIRRDELLNWGNSTGASAPVSHAPVLSITHTQKVPRTLVQ